MKGKEPIGIADEIYEKLVYAYKLDDSALYLARIVADAWEDRGEARKVMKKEGITVKGQNLAVKSHPANDIIKVCNTQIMQAFKQLGLSDQVREDGVLKDFE